MSKRRKRRRKKSGGKLLAVLFALIILALVLTPYVTKFTEENTHPLKYQDYISKYSKEYNVPSDLLFATIKVESSFNPNAESNAGALGLTQITPDTFDWLKTKTGEEYEFEDLKRPEISIKYCAVFYSILLEEFGNAETIETAIAAYHAGMNKVNTWLENPEYSADGVTLTKIPSKATAHYVNKVTNAINVYNSLYEKENLA